MKSSKVIPEELQNALDANKELGSVARQSENHMASLLLNGGVMLLGFLVGMQVHRAIDADVISAMLTFCGIVIGFVITSMLFSGRNEYVERLSLEQTQKYCLKIKYMLLSQSNTLFSYIFCSAFLVTSLILIKLNLHNYQDIFISLSLSYLVLGAYRTLVLPYQIYEVHSFALQSIADEAIERSQSDITSQAKSRVLNFKTGVSTISEGDKSD